MNEADFWRVIGSPKRNDDGFKATGSLCVKLKALAPDEIHSFYLLLLEKLSLLCTPEILGAASLITCNGCDFLEFHFFRTWVISLGQKAYEVALHNPDSLISAKACFSVSMRGEDFDSYVSIAPLIYCLKTGQSLVKRLRSENPSFSAMPEPIDDLETFSDDELRVRYPQLWAQNADSAYAAQRHAVIE